MRLDTTLGKLDAAKMEEARKKANSMRFPKPKKLKKNETKS